MNEIHTSSRHDGWLSKRTGRLLYSISMDDIGDDEPILYLWLRWKERRGEVERKM